MCDTSEGNFSDGVSCVCLFSGVPRPCETDRAQRLPTRCFKVRAAVQTVSQTQSEGLGNPAESVRIMLFYV